jgi:Transposase
VGHLRQAATAALDRFFADLGEHRADRLEAISMDMGAAYAKSAGKHATQATACIDPFHAVAKVTEALDKVRRAEWNALRKLDPTAAKRFKDARWALLKNPTKLTEDQQATLRKLRRRGGTIWRAYTLKEAFRAIFAGDLNPDEAGTLIDRWISKALRSRIDAFVAVAKTIRKHRDGILATLKLGINNGRAEDRAGPCACSPSRPRQGTRRIRRTPGPRMDLLAPVDPPGHAHAFLSVTAAVPDRRPNRADPLTRNESDTVHHPAAVPDQRRLTPLALVTMAPPTPSQPLPPPSHPTRVITRQSPETVET